jgi:hypothetical protein
VKIIHEHHGLELPDFAVWLRKNLDPKKWRIAICTDGYSDEVSLKRCDGLVPILDTKVAVVYDTVVKLNYPEYFSDMEKWILEFEKQGGEELTLRVPET